MRKDSHFKEISLNEIQTREENVTLWWRHNITWSSSPNLGFETMASQSDHLSDVDPNVGVSGESPPPVQQQGDLSSSNDDPHPARDSGSQTSRASAGTSSQLQSRPRVGHGGSPFAQTLRGYRIPKVQHVAGFDSPDPSSDSGTEGYQDGYDDSDDASDSAYGDTPVPGPSRAGPAGPTRSHDARFFRGHDFQDGGRRMFNPHAVDDDKNMDNLNDEQVNYLQNYFDEFIPDDVVEQSILAEAPVPELTFLKTRKVDQDVLALLPEQTQKPVKRADLDYQLISRRNKFTLGPLCKLWGNLAAARTDPETFDVDSALTLVEQTVCTVGQTHQTIEFQRRQAVLGRIIRDRQKCRDILIQNDVLLKSNKKHLFGSDFYMALSRKAKGSKRLREAKRELQGPPPKRRRFPNQPFPGGAPPVGRGGAQQSTNSGGYQQSQNFRGRPRSGRGRGRGTPSATSTSAAAGAPASQSGQRGGRRRYVCFLLPNLKFRYGFRSKYYNKSGSRPSQRSRYIGGQTASFPLKLGKTVSGPIHSVNSQRNDNRLASGTITTKRNSMPKILKKSVKSNLDRSEQAGREKCDRSDQTFSKPVCQSYLSSVKERWDQQTGHKSQTAKQTRQVHAFQNGRDSESGRSLTTRRSHVQVRPQRCLFCNPSGSSVSGISKVSLELSPLQIQSSPLRSRLSSTYLLKIDETDNSRDETFRNQMCNLSRRSHSLTSGTSDVTKPATNDNLSVAKPGVHHQLGKICDKSNTENRVSGLSHRFILNDNVSTHAKIKRPSKSMSKAVEERADISQTVGQNHRENVRSSEGHPSGSSSIQASTTLENSSVVSGPSKLRVSDSDHTRMQSKTAVVDRIGSTVERTISDKTQSRSVDQHNNRCQSKGMGSPLCRSENSRTLDSRRAKAPHQCSGNQSCNVRCESIHQKQVPGKCASPSGQYHDNVLHQQNGRDKIYGHDKHLKNPVGLLSQQTDHTYSRVSSRDSESNSRCPVSELPRFEQLETEQIHFPGNNQNNWSSGDRFIRGPNQCSGAQVHQLATRSGVLGNRCFHGLVVWRCGICFPPILSNRQMPGQDQTGPSFSHHDHTYVANPTVVPRNFVNVDFEPNIAASSSQSDHISVTAATSPSKPRPGPSGLAAVRRQASATNLSEEAKSLLQKYRRDSSQSTYKTPWRKWTSWCDWEQIDPMDATVEQIADFLADRFQNESLEYSTLNVYRSAISAYHPSRDGYKIGEHPLIRDLM